MRAKLVIETVTTHPNGSEDLKFRAVGRDDSYPEDGSDENNTFAKFTPSAELSMHVANPALQGKFKAGQQFYVDFTPCESGD